jgi:hypothetical protein
MSKPEPGPGWWRKTTAVHVDTATLRLAEQQIESCESCDAADAEIPFDCVLDELMECDPRSTDYVLSEPARCPRCEAPIRAGAWRSYTSANHNGGQIFVLPGTLVKLRRD